MKKIEQKINNFIRYHSFLKPLFEFQVIFIPSSFFAIGVKTLNNRITYLEGEVSILKNENMELKKQISALNIKYNGQQKTIDSQKKQIYDLNIKNKQLKKDNEQLKIDIEVIKKSFEQVIEDNKKMMQKIELIEKNKNGYS